MLLCTDICVTYRAGESTSTPLRHLDLKLDSGAAALMGPSGSGKSTLLRVIAGLQRPTSGRVELDGVEVAHDESNPEMDPRISLVHQDYRLVSFLDVRDNLQIARSFKGQDLASDRDIAEVLERVGLDGFAARMPASLSGGEQQRVAIARSLLVGCRLILADEPTGSLDRENSLVVAHTLAALARDLGVLVLVATHDHAVADALGCTLQLAELDAHR